MNQWARGSEYPGRGRAKADGARGSDASGRMCAGHGAGIR